MKKDDFNFIKNGLKNDFLLNDFICIKQTKTKYLKVCYNDKVITISENIGFAYLISWWCDGSITSGEAKSLNDLCKKYNERF